MDTILTALKKVIAEVDPAKPETWLNKTFEFRYAGKIARFTVNDIKDKQVLVTDNLNNKTAIPKQYIAHGLREKKINIVS